MMRKYYYSQEQFELLERHFISKGQKMPVNEVKCDDGVFRRFSSQYPADDQGPSFNDLYVVHTGEFSTVRHNGHESINDR